MNRPIIVLLTDFGTVDPFVGIMKGVIAGRCPEASVVDLTHAVPPQAVGEASFWLERSFRWFPPSTIFVAVVDPGVGTERRGIVAGAHGRIFVGPDNGLLPPAIHSDPSWRAFEIDTSALGLGLPSRTFHGRDVFAPVAAELAAGRLTLDTAGRRLSSLVSASFPVFAPAEFGEPGVVEGVVVTVDRFGNLITNIGAPAGLAELRVEVGGADIPVGGTYADVAVGAHVALVNAFDVLEIAQRDGDAARSLGIGRGARVRLHAKPGS